MNVRKYPNFSRHLSCNDVTLEVKIVWYAYYNLLVQKMLLLLSSGYCVYSFFLKARALIGFFEVTWQ